MEFGELTIAQILLTAFSGFGLIILSWVFGKKIIGRFRSKDKRTATKVNQTGNIVGGDMAGGNIVKGNKDE